jgi:hypothetical protein
MRDADKLETTIARLPRYTAPAGWRDRVLAAIDAGAQRAPTIPVQPPHRNRSRWLGAGALMVAAAAAIYLTAGRAPAPRPLVVEREPSIVAEPRAGNVARRGERAVGLGGSVVIRVRDARAVRAYQGGALVARCPGDAGCTSTVDELSLELRVTSHGELRAIAYAVALPDSPTDRPPSASDLDADIALATSMQIKMKMSAPIDGP